jgi:hypothetical protein
VYKHVALFSIGAALVFSMFFVDASHAFQIDLKKQAEMQRAATPITTQVSTMSKPCVGRDGAACKKYRSMLR